MATRSLLLLASAAAALADRASLDCPLRQIGLDYAQSLQPFRPRASFQEFADALNGAQEAVNCSVVPTAGAPTDSRVLSFPLPAAGAVVFADAALGCDVKGDGSVARPFSSLPRAVAAVRALRVGKAAAALSERDRATVVLRAGTFFLRGVALELTPADSFLTLQAFPGEQVTISGGVPISGVSWAPVAPPARALYEFRAGQLGAGFDAAPPQMLTVAAGQAACSAMPTCAGITYNNALPDPGQAVLISFKYEVFWAAQSGWGSWVRNVGYEAGAANLYVADVSMLGLQADITALRVNGARAVRARYPNVKTVEQMDAMQIDAAHWTPQSAWGLNKNAAYTVNPATPLRDDTIQGFFQTFKLGVGGDCAMRFTPQAAYWCADNTQGGGPGPYSAPVGMTVSNAQTSLPHTPYGAAAASTALVHSWRAGRWFSWVFQVTGLSYDAGSGNSVFNFSLAVGGNQGSRGGDSGQEFFIENVIDELDAPGEFFYDAGAKKLYLWYNATGGTPPPSAGIVATQQTVLINQTGTQANPVRGISYLGMTFRDTSPNYLGPHGTPSGGDWAVGRSAALFFEGTEGALLQGSLLTQLDGNAVFFSGYNRNATVDKNEFLGIGETAVSQWGYTAGSPVPGLGFDTTPGDQPRYTSVTYNLVHEVGLWTKQNSFYFQSESMYNTIEGNIAYNGPRAGVNFDDGCGGGSVLTRNVLANFCRESSDHGPFNSWDRQVYLFKDPDTGVTTVFKKNDTISLNFILANYHSSMAIDNDDGSAFYDTHDNVFISASSGAAYGGNSLKSDFGGHSNFHHANVDLFWSSGFGINGQLEGYADGYYENFLYQSKDGAYGGGQTCSGAGKTIVGGNTIWSPTGAITECGTSLTNWQAQGNDVGTVGLPYPADAVILAQVKKTLLMQ